MLWRGCCDRSYWHNFGERFGFGAAAPPGGVWLHAVSVGEVQACAPLVSALCASAIPRSRSPSRPSRPRARRAPARSSATSPRCATCPTICRAPCGDSSRACNRRLAVIFETELWPNLYHECGRRRVPLVLASARISARSVSRYRRLGRLFSEHSRRGRSWPRRASRMPSASARLGADPGSHPCDRQPQVRFQLPADIAERGGGCARITRPASDVGGRQHARRWEEATCSRRTAEVRAAHPQRTAGPGAAPPAALRGGRRGAARAQECAFARRSQRQSENAGDGRCCCSIPWGSSWTSTRRPMWPSSVAVSSPVGGHNLLEPAALGVPILTGPHNFNSAEIARLLIARGAAEVVHDARGAGAAGSRVCSRIRRRGRASARADATASTATAAHSESCWR